MISAHSSSKFVFMALLVSFTSGAAVFAQELGTSFGIPNSSAAVFWPRGMSLESLSPQNLYPNGPQFGLCNTSGGFGMTGSAPMSGLGLEERSVSNLVREELRQPGSSNLRLMKMFGAESARSNSIFNVVLGNRFKREIQSPVAADYSKAGDGSLINPSALPSVDSVLHDQSASTESILKTSL